MYAAVGDEEDEEVRSRRRMNGWTIVVGGSVAVVMIVVAILYSFTHLPKQHVVKKSGVVYIGDVDASR
jgi:hypothetical protein